MASVTSVASDAETEVSEDPPRLAHQPALDGLRGLAVLAVMVFHLRYVGGGFLGVDIFFVLSGFLITTLLLIDHAKTGKVISVGFWRRRARRLFPPIIVFLAIITLFAATVAKPVDLDAIRHGAFATVLYVQNYWLIRHPRDFFSPLNHTWSLSIEEQFYLVWPILLALLLRFTRHTKWLVAVVIALACASAVLMVTRYTSTHTTGSAYVSTETRAHELLIGAALGIILLRRRFSGVALEIAGTVALIFLVVAVFLAGEHESLLYQGGFFLIAIATAVLIAAVVSEGPSRLRAALAWKPIIWVGLISYGLYLYHVPLFSFVNAQDVVTGREGRAALGLALAFAVAIASFFLIEQPIRRGALTRVQFKVLAPVAVVAVLAMVMVTTTGGTPPPASELQAAVFEKAKRATPEGTLRVLVAGDSMATSLATAERPEFSGEGIHGVVQWAAECDQPLGGRVAIGTLVGNNVFCKKLPVSYYSAKNTYQPDVSVLVLGATIIFDREVDDERLEVGTPEFEKDLFRRLDYLRKLLSRPDGAFMLTTVGCMDPPATGQYAGFAPIQRDPKRRAAINASLQRYADDRDVTLGDLGTLICDHPEYLGADGVNLNSDGALAAWKFLAPIAREAAANRDPTN